MMQLSTQPWSSFAQSALQSFSFSSQVFSCGRPAFSLASAQRSSVAPFALESQSQRALRQTFQHTNSDSSQIANVSVHDSYVSVQLVEHPVNESSHSWMLDEAALDVTESTVPASNKYIILMRSERKCNAAMVRSSSE